MTEPTFTIPKDIIEPIVKSHIEAAFVTAFGERDTVMRTLIERVLSTKVDKEGHAERYASSDSPTFLEYVLSGTVQKVIRESLLEACKNHTEVLKDALVDQLKQRRSPFVQNLANAMVKGFENVGKGALSFTVNWEPEPGDSGRKSKRPCKDFDTETF